MCAHCPSLSHRSLLTCVCVCVLTARVCPAGHYWAYVRVPERGGWLKFNDITVSEAGWEELEKEGVGGYHNASAYCLMYIDANKCDSLLGEKTGSLLPVLTLVLEFCI